MQYKTREAFLTDYYRLKPYITERELNQYAYAETPFEYYTLGCVYLSDIIEGKSESCGLVDSEEYDAFFHGTDKLKHLSTLAEDKPLVAELSARGNTDVRFVIDFENNEIYRDEFLRFLGYERYAIMPDGKVYDI